MSVTYPSIPHAASSMKRTSSDIQHTRVSAYGGAICPVAKYGSRILRAGAGTTCAIPRSSCTDHQMERKMVFYLYKELSSPLITAMEEISDVRRITDQCMSTLESMKRCQNCKKYLYHTRINTSNWNNIIMCPCKQNYLNKSNNSEFKKKQLAERVFGTSVNKRPSVVVENTSPELAEKRRKESLKYTTHKIDGLRDTSRFDQYDEEFEKSMSTENLQMRSKNMGESSRGSRKQLERKDSVRPQDFKFYPTMSSTPSMARKITGMKETPAPKFTVAEEVEAKEDSDTDLNLITNIHLTQRQLALKLLAEIQNKMEKRSKPDPDNIQKPAAAITPQEALQCAWLRLSKEQVQTLEGLIRQQGKDPGIHAHSDVTNYDVFAEIREIRRKEKVLKEEDENSRK